MADTINKEGLAWSIDAAAAINSSEFSPDDYQRSSEVQRKSSGSFAFEHPLASGKSIGLSPHRRTGSLFSSQLLLRCIGLEGGFM